MRVWTRRALALSAACGAAVLWSGCEAKKQTEYVTGISTQVQVPRDLKTIRVDVNVGGAPAHCRTYPVFDGRVKLPRSLGQLPTENADLGNPIQVTVVGFTESADDPSRTAEFDCTKRIVAGDNARILRRSRQPYVKDRILLLPMALRFSCFDKDCGDESGKTCKAGRCVDAATDERLLPEYSEELLEGTGGACFKVKECFAAAVPPVVVNADDCTYALPNSPSAPPLAEGAPPNPLPSGGEGVNVRVVYDGGFNAEILDKDPDEGFAIPDPSKPQQFRLAPGLCDMVKGYDQDGRPVSHRVTGVFASGTCQAKGPFQPLCRDDMLAAVGADPAGVSKTASITASCTPTQLRPPKSAVLLLLDATAHSKNYLNEKINYDVPLSDPAFENTDLGAMTLPGATGKCMTNPALDVAPENARSAKPKVVMSLLSTFQAIANDSNFGKSADLDGALDGAYKLLQSKYPDAHKRAVFLISNHDFGTSACGIGEPSALAQRAAAPPLATPPIPPVKTYVTMVTKDADPAAPQQSAGDAVAVAAAGLATGGTGVYDARFGNGPAQEAFRDLVNDLATCVYDTTTIGALSDDRELSYSDPVTGVTKKIAHSTGNCAGPSDSGWATRSAKRLDVCGQACADYRDVRQKAAAYSAQYLKPALAVPMFAHAKGCAPDAGGKPSGP